MYRVRRNRNVWRTKWPFRKLWPPGLNDRFCKECSQPYIDGPVPKAVRSFQAGSVCAVLYPEGGFKGNRVVVRLGRWKPSGGKFYHSEYIQADEIDDLETVVAQVRDYLAACTPQPRQRFAAPVKPRHEGVTSKRRSQG